MGPQLQTLTLLGMDFQEPELEQDEETWDKRDVAAKKQLRLINRYRMETLGRASMTGIALNQKTGEQWQTILANRRREHEERKHQRTEEDNRKNLQEIRDLQLREEQRQREEERNQELEQDRWEEDTRETVRRYQQQQPMGEM